MSLSDIVHRFKLFTTHLYSKGVKEQGWVAFPGRLWQRNYYERIIRGDDEMSKIREYIENNPCAWDEDEDNPYKIGKSQQLAHVTPMAAGPWRYVELFVRFQNKRLDVITSKRYNVPRK